MNREDILEGSILMDSKSGEGNDSPVDGVSVGPSRKGTTVKGRQFPLFGEPWDAHVAQTFIKGYPFGEVVSAL
jgi:hypothetical protein